MIKYEARIYGRYGFRDQIKKVEVEKETDKSVWIRGSRRAKDSEYTTYFDTFEDAKNALIKRQEGYLDRLETTITDAKLMLFKIRQLSE